MKTEETKEELQTVATPSPVDEGTIVVNEDAFEQTDIEIMARAGVLYGHRTFRRNPKFGDYVYAVRNGVEIIDLVKTAKAIEVVAQFLKEEKAKGKSFVIVATQPAAQEAAARLSAALGDCPYVVYKWIGGLLSNFAIISKRLEYYKKRKKDFAEGRFEKYTKRERLLIEREISKMNNKFKGLEDFTQMPDILFVIDGSLRGHKTAMREAKLKRIQCVGIIDSDDNPEEFDYFVPANDHSKSSVDLVVDRIITNLS